MAAPRSTTVTAGGVTGLVCGILLLGCGAFGGLVGSLAAAGTGELRAEADTSTWIDVDCDTCDDGDYGQMRSMNRTQTGDGCGYISGAGVRCPGIVTVTERPATAEEQKAADIDDKQLEAVQKGAGRTAFGSIVTVLAGLVACVASIGVFQRKHWGRFTAIGAGGIALFGVLFGALAHPMMGLVMAPVPLVYLGVTIGTLFTGGRAAEFS